MENIHNLSAIDIDSLALGMMIPVEDFDEYDF